MSSELTCYKRAGDSVPAYLRSPHYDLFASVKFVKMTFRWSLPLVEGCLKLQKRGIIDVILLKIFPILIFVPIHEVYEAMKPVDLRCMYICCDDKYELGILLATDRSSGAKVKGLRATTPPAPGW
jgi:hypothetical protein